MQASTVPTATQPPGGRRAELDLAQQARMVQALRSSLGVPPGAEVTVIETHISYVLVGREHAYKLKKALRTPFLDQSTLALRQRACHEELRLNRRLAPDLYLAAVPVTGTATAPELEGAGEPIDMAVKMRTFDQDAMWDRLAARGGLRLGQIDELVQVLGPFHAAAAVADPGGRLGSPAQVRAPLRESLDELAGLMDPGDGLGQVGRLRAWEAAAFGRLQPAMAQRLAQGRVRECHGDLHLGNVTTFDGRTTLFDGIEFNDDFRWIDVMSEVAFMAMDLHAHGLPSFAHRFVNGYLESCGDYDGLVVLDYYLVHRALVRAKVGLLRAAQCAAADAGQAAVERTAACRYLQLALQFSQGAGQRAALMFTHGCSGSGKSTLTQGLLEAAGAIRIRADAERKRLAGLQPLDHEGLRRVPTLYGPAMTQATYARLAQGVVPVLRSGRHAILDATFLQRSQRDAVRQLAASLGVPCAILDFQAEPEELRRRLSERATRGSDPSDADAAVLRAQLQTAQELQADEAPWVYRCRPTMASGRVQGDWAGLLAWLDSGADRPQA
jgi:aminoglycoside phosphotransferase family enzyme/predicted kinase